MTFFFCFRHRQHAIFCRGSLGFFSRSRPVLCRPFRGGLLWRVQPCSPSIRVLERKVWRACKWHLTILYISDSVRKLPREFFGSRDDSQLNHDYYHWTTFANPPFARFLLASFLHFLSRNFRRSFCIYLCMVLIFLFQAFVSTNCCCSPRAILDLLLQKCHINVTRGNSASLKLRQTWSTLFIDALGGVQIWRRLSDHLSRFLDDVFKSHFLARHPSVPLEIWFLVLSDI